VLLVVLGGAQLAIAQTAPPIPRVVPPAPSIPRIVPPAPPGGAPIAPPPRRAAPPRVAPGTTIIEQIIVEGTQRIDPATVRSYMTLKEGDRFDAGRINESLKALFATGLFADVTIRREDDALAVRVVENPVINRIAFEGNDSLDDETLSPEVQLRPRVVFTRTKVQKDVKRLLDLYQRSGHFAAVIEPKIIKLPQNRVDLVFEIQEGPESGIRKISFIGNRLFSDSDLRDVILTTESKWWRIFTAADKYAPDRLTFDRELLRRFYLENGYADFRVTSAVAELAPDRKDFFVTFTIEEGERYKFGSIDISSRIPEIKPEALMPHVKFETGDWYNSKLLDDTVLELTNEAGNVGYAFAEVRPKVRRDREKRIINIVFEVQEGPRVFVERIDIRGNTRTLDEVVRREFRLVEGDAFNAARLRRSEQRIRNLGYFSKVEVNKARGSTPDKTVIEVDVQEQPTGELSLGAGFSTRDGVVGEIGIRERNLLGRGQDLRFSIRASQRTQQFDIGFTEPYFLDRNLSAGVDLFSIRSSRLDESSFRQDTFGGRLRMGYEINERWSQGVRYGFEYENITDVDDGASQIIKDQSGSRLISTVGQTLTFDTRDSKISPTKGFVSRLAADYAGVGGDVRYIKGTWRSRFYYPIAKKWIGSLATELGHVRGLGEDVRVTDRFVLGNDRLRGFRVGGVGPRDKFTGDALGADTFGVATVELSFPLGLPDEFGMKGALFTDVGTAFGADGPSSLILDSKAPRGAAGVGISWASPLGPVRFNYAIPFMKESFDKSQRFSFSFGTRF
jgi:outer membrane protein insertion porin family